MPTSTWSSSHLGSRVQDANANPDERDANTQTPLLQKTPLKPVTVSKRIALLLQNWWLWEIVSASTAVLAATVIIIILLVFDQSSLPDWPSVFTVRCVHILDSQLLLNYCVDQLSHLLLCNHSEAFHHVGCWCLHLPIKMAMVPPR